MRVTIRDIKTGQFAGYYGVFVGRVCHVYTPSWVDAVLERDKLTRQQAYAD